MKHLVTYIGDALNPHGPASVPFRGVDFPLNQPVALDVTTSDGEAMIAKLKGHPHFRVEDAPEEAKPAKGKKAAATEPDA